MTSHFDADSLTVAVPNVHFLNKAGLLKCAVFYVKIATVVVTSFGVIDQNIGRDLSKISQMLHKQSFDSSRGKKTVSRVFRQNLRTAY